MNYICFNLKYENYFVFSNLIYFFFINFEKTFTLIRLKTSSQSPLLFCLNKLIFGYHKLLSRLECQYHCALVGINIQVCFFRIYNRNTSRWPHTIYTWTCRSNSNSVWYIWYCWRGNNRIAVQVNQGGGTSVAMPPWGCLYTQDEWQKK